MSAALLPPVRWPHSSVCLLVAFILLFAYGWRCSARVWLAGHAVLTPFRLQPSELLLWLGRQKSTPRSLLASPASAEDTGRSWHASSARTERQRKWYVRGPKALFYSRAAATTTACSRPHAAVPSNANQ